MKDNRKGFYISSNRLNKKYGGLLLNGAGDILTVDTYRAEVLNAFICFRLHQKRCPRSLCALKGFEENQQCRTESETT